MMIVMPKPNITRQMHFTAFNKVNRDFWVYVLTKKCYETNKI